MLALGRMELGRGGGVGDKAEGNANKCLEYTNQRLHTRFHLNSLFLWPDSGFFLFVVLCS